MVFFAKVLLRFGIAQCGTVVSGYVKHAKVLFWQGSARSCGVK